MSEIVVPDGLIYWLAGGERGISSNTIVQHLTGIPAARDSMDHPYDSGEFRRCVLLLESVPALRIQMPGMATCSASWAALVAHWDELEALLRRECAGDFTRTRHAPLTYRRLKQVLAGAARG